MNKNLAIILLTLIIGLGGGYWIATINNTVKTDSSNVKSEQSKVLYWRNPMNPAITSPVFTTGL